MSLPAISVQDLSKRYRIGAHLNGRTFRESLTELVTGPFHRIKSLGRSSHREQDSIWALKDVSFEVQPGEAVGIIGPNGAGKTTLLKILSRITEPTEGRAVIHGRVASLLEVGTGFHSELTGRENIYLSGAILGMRKKEIDAKFEEIAEFSGIEQFIDTPVKRYSSGMRVRLGFAVAAHLEPEILLIDEVLAVGDAEFQKRCLGKMDEVARGGRTVLFVSHNMGAIRNLCPKSFCLDQGRIALHGESEEVVGSYVSSARVHEVEGEVHWEEASSAPGCEEFRLRAVRLLGPAGAVQAAFEADKPIGIEIVYEVHRPVRGIRVNLGLETMQGELAFASSDHNCHRGEVEPGIYKSVCRIPGGLLNIRKYIVKVGAGIPGFKVLLPFEGRLSLVTNMGGCHGSIYSEKWPGVVCPKLEWNVERVVNPET